MSIEATLNPPTFADVPHHAVQDQLQRVLSSALFNHSRRYPAFLRYVVDEVLKGNKEQLKERSIGVQVFGRSPDYDLNVDPIVRVTAGEVRKRLAQYYYEAGHQDELRIEMHRGSYIPEFKLASELGKTPAPARLGQTPARPLASAALSSIGTPQPARDIVEQPPPNIAELPSTAEATVTSAPLIASAKSWPVRWILGGCLLGLTAIAFGLYVSRPHSALDRFWLPALQGRSPVLIAVGSWDTPVATARDLSIGVHAKSSAPVALADMMAIAGLQQILAARGKSEPHPDIESNVVLGPSAGHHNSGLRLR